MINLLSQHQLSIIDDMGLLAVAVPYPYQIDGTKEEQTQFAAAYLKSNYNLNWQDSALLVGFDIAQQQIFLKFLNTEVLQIILIDTGVGSEIFNEFSKLSGLVDFE